MKCFSLFLETGFPFIIPAHLEFTGQLKDGLEQGSLNLQVLQSRSGNPLPDCNISLKKKYFADMLLSTWCHLAEVPNQELNRP